MKAIAIDSNVLIDFLHGDMRFRQVLVAAETILVSPVVFAEVSAGFDETQKGHLAKKKFLDFLALDMVERTSIGYRTAELYVSIHNFLKKQGTPIPQNDMWLAASVLEHEAAILTTDSHFDNIPHLTHYRLTS